MDAAFARLNLVICPVCNGRRDFISIKPYNRARALELTTFHCKGCDTTKGYVVGAQGVAIEEPQKPDS